MPPPHPRRGTALRRARAPAPPSTSSAVAEALEEARELSWSGQHAAAIEVATAALAVSDCDDASRIGLLESRAESLTARGDVDRALEDAEAMIAIAKRSRRIELEAQALNTLSRVQLASGSIDGAVETADQAHGIAKRSLRKPLISTCLLNLAAAQMRARKSTVAVENARAAEPPPLYGPLPDSTRAIAGVPAGASRDRCARANEC
jgi:tetratricopeptide (TPR) repeat protein